MLSLPIEFPHRFLLVLGHCFESVSFIAELLDNVSNAIGLLRKVTKYPACFFNFLMFAVHLLIFLLNIYSKKFADPVSSKLNSCCGWLCYDVS